jgi:lipoyl(octanoyl) transferase
MPAMSEAVDLRADLEWRIATGLVPYPEALAEMEARARAIRDDSARELVWLLEHPPLYTAGTSADPAELFNPSASRSMMRARRPLHLSRAPASGSAI